MGRDSTLVTALVIVAVLLLAATCCQTHAREGFEESRALACGCDPWSEHCVVPPRGAPSYGCIRSFDDHVGECTGGPSANDGHWLQWGFGHGHPLTAGHRERETKKIASAVFGADSNLTRQLKNEAVRRDARAAERGSGDSRPPSGSGDSTPPSGSGATAAPLGGGGLTPPKGGVHDLARHPDSPKPALECGALPEGGVRARHETADAVYADPKTTYTDMPVHLPTSHDLHPDQDTSLGHCRPSVTGIFQVCGPWAAGV